MLAVIYAVVGEKEEASCMTVWDLLHVFWVVGLLSCPVVIQKRKGFFCSHGFIQ